MRCSPFGMSLRIALVALAITLPGRAAPEGGKDKEPPAAKPGPRAEVLAFLKDHVIGKTLTTGPTVGKLEEKLEYEFSRRTAFCDLAETDKGLTFDVLNVVVQTNYDLDDKGKRLPPGRVQNRVVTTRYELRQLESAPLLVGGARLTANSIVDPTGSVGLVQMEMKDGKLIVHESTQMTDYFAPGGKFRLVADENAVEFAVVGGKLERTQTIASYDVDPATLKRTPHGEPSKLVDKEDEAGAQTGLDRLQGAWQLASKERNGEKQDIKKTIVTFTGDKFETTADGKATEAGTIQIDPSKSPKTYDVTIKGDFAENGNTYRGIYELDGDTLRTCVQVDPQKERPTEFVSKQGSGLQLIVWKRVKP